jgi:hypothetical protein
MLWAEVALAVGTVGAVCHWSPHISAKVIADGLSGQVRWLRTSVRHADTVGRQPEAASVARTACTWQSALTCVGEIARRWKRRAHFPTSVDVTVQSGGQGCDCDVTQHFATAVRERAAARLQVDCGAYCPFDANAPRRLFSPRKHTVTPPAEATTHRGGCIRRDDEAYMLR